MPAFAGHTTQRADFPHCALPFASLQGSWDLSGWGRFQSVASHSIAVEQPESVVQPRPIPPLPAEALSFPGLRQLAPDLLLHPIFDVAEALTGVSKSRASPKRKSVEQSLTRKHCRRQGNVSLQVNTSARLALVAFPHRPAPNVDCATMAATKTTRKLAAWQLRFLAVQKRRGPVGLVAMTVRNEMPSGTFV